MLFLTIFCQKIKDRVIIENKPRDYITKGVRIMENVAQNQSDLHAERSRALFDAALMFEQLPSEVRKALLELMRQMVEEG